MAITTAEFAERAIRLFAKVREELGIADADFPDQKPSPQDLQCEFETDFVNLICEYKGHDMAPDHCGKPEHDFCPMCNQRRDSLTGWISNDFRTKEG